MIQIEVTEHEAWVIRYSLRVLAGLIPKPNECEPSEKILSDEAEALYKKLLKSSLGDIFITPKGGD